METGIPPGQNHHGLDVGVVHDIDDALGRHWDHRSPSHRSRDCERRLRSIWPDPHCAPDHATWKQAGSPSAEVFFLIGIGSGFVADLPLGLALLGQGLLQREWIKMTRKKQQETSVLAGI